MIVQIKILKGVAPILVGKREKRTSYVTNRELKAFDLYVCLKAITTAGHIKNYPAQLEKLTEFSKCSKATFYTRLWMLVEMQLITVKGLAIQLCSWEKVAELYELNTLEFHKVNYDTQNKQQNIEYILKAIEIGENQERQTKEAQRKINKTPELESVFNIQCMKQNKQADFTLNNLHAVQCETYATGAADYDILHSINADVNRSAKRIKLVYGFHSIRNVAYMKRQLEKRGLATITKRVAPVCRYAEHAKPEKKERGNPVSIGAITALIMPNILTANLTHQIKKGSKSTAYTTFYSKKNNARIWRRVDKIELNDKVFKNA